MGLNVYNFVYNEWMICMVLCVHVAIPPCGLICTYIVETSFNMIQLNHRTWNSACIYETDSLAPLWTGNDSSFHHHYSNSCMCITSVDIYWEWTDSYWIREKLLILTEISTFVCFKAHFKSRSGDALGSKDYVHLRGNSNIINCL